MIKSQIISNSKIRTGDHQQVVKDLRTLLIYDAITNNTITGNASKVHRVNMAVRTNNSKTNLIRHSTMKKIVNERGT